MYRFFVGWYASLKNQSPSFGFPDLVASVNTECPGKKAQS